MAITDVSEILSLNHTVACSCDEHALFLNPTNQTARFSLGPESSKEDLKTRTLTAEASAACDAAFDSHPGEQPLFLRPGEREQRWEEPVLRGRTMVDAAWEVPAERVLERFLLRLPPELDTEWAESSLRFFAEEVRVLKEGLIWVRALPEGMVRRLQERGIIVEMA